MAPTAELPRASERARRGRRRVLALVGLGATVATFVAGAASAVAVPSANLVGAITRVDIATPTSGPFDRVRVDLGFAIPDPAVAGDQFHLTLPPQLTPVGPGFEVRDTSGAVIATAVTSGNIVTFTTTAFVDDHDRIAGTAFLQAIWNRSRIDAGATVALTFDADGTPFSDSVVLSGGLPDRSLVGAWQGWYDERAEDTSGPVGALRWSATTPRIGPAGASTISIAVLAGNGSSIMCDRVSVLESTKLDGFNEVIARDTVPAARRTITCDPTKVAVTVTGTGASTWVMVTGRSTVVDSSLAEYTNLAMVDVDGSSSSATGVATHSSAGGKGGGATRTAASAGGGSATTAATPRQRTAASGSAGVPAAASDGGGDAAAAPETTEPAAATGAGPDVGLDIVAPTPPAVELATASNPGLPADRSNGFQWRALAFLAATIGVAVAFVLRRRRRDEVRRVAI